MAVQDHTIQREDGPSRGRYFIELGGGAEAEMTFSKSGTGPLVIDHTGVPREFEGRGIAAKLVNAAIADARSEGFKIQPVCSYVVAQFRRHQNLSDVLA